MDTTPDRIAAIRSFNRFYTRQIGLLKDGMLQSPYSLTELRVLYDLGERDDWTASRLGRHLGLDAGYLSRILAKFTRQGLVERHRSPQDARRSLLALTTAGQAARADYDAQSSAEVRRLLAPLGEDARQSLVGAMVRIQSLLAPDEDAATAPLVLRPHRPGDIGWIIQRHGERYHRDYGWSGIFEALVAEIGAAFLRAYDPTSDCCLIAELGGNRVGSVMVVRENANEARLRLLLVEPHARGRGVGRRLVEEALRFAVGAGYGAMVLWTNDVLHSARRIYEAQGFILESEEPHQRFGPPMKGQTWRLDLGAWRRSQP